MYCCVECTHAKRHTYNSSQYIKGINFVWNVVEGVEKKQMTDKVNEIMKQKTIVCFVSKNERATVLLSISEDLKIDAPKLLNEVLNKFNGRGGGRDNFAMGSLETQYADKFIEELKKLILDNT
jgi:alanyl-tRNA synthetase